MSDIDESAAHDTEQIDGDPGELRYESSEWRVTFPGRFEEIFQPEITFFFSFFLAVIDWIIYNHRFDVYQIVGVILIGFGFVFIALPERWLGIKILVQKLRRQTSTVPAAVTASATKTAAIKERAAWSVEF